MYHRCSSIDVPTLTANSQNKSYKTGMYSAPSDYPEFAQFLVQQGIDSISLNPDSVVKTTLAIAVIEDDLTYNGISDKGS